ncbi:hypothetical protein X797_006267 [Metarhizium robertsii]|uniref:Uncharacterized protein n=1 Tax=Metarhizium robertsii TaxID=568076 RepID=A0A014PAB2_9HYPO|nr:hypothetical protein X797_006267 [Metarhizium robertsii]
MSDPETIKLEYLLSYPEYLNKPELHLDKIRRRYDQARLECQPLRQHDRWRASCRPRVVVGAKGDPSILRRGLLHYASHERCRAGQGPTAAGVRVCPAVSVHGLSHHAGRGREGPAGDVDGVLPGGSPGDQEHGFHRLAGAPIWEDEGAGGGAREQDRGE